MENEDYLEGICEFPAIVNNKPSQVIIANPFMTIDDPDPVCVCKGRGRRCERGSVWIAGRWQDCRIQKGLMAFQELETSFGDRGVLLSSPANPTALM